jgi:hypothetical protein
LQKLFHKGNLLFLLGIAILIVWLVTSPVAAKDSPTLANSVNASLTSENWTSGITVEGAPTYSSVVGRLVSNVAAFRSARSAQAATIFPAPASEKIIEAASIYLLSRSGSYNGKVTLSLAVYDISGTLKHKVNTIDVNLQTTPTGAWVPLILSTTTSDVTIAPGEFLAFCYTLSSGAAGDLDVRPLFDVTVQ